MALSDKEISALYFEALGSQHLREQDRKMVTRFAHAVEAEVRKQAVRDAYEDVLGIDWFELMRNNFDKERSEHIAESIETAIRALIKEIV